MGGVILVLALLMPYCVFFSLPIAILNFPMLICDFAMQARSTVTLLKTECSVQPLPPFILPVIGKVFSLLFLRVS